jgi:RND family efflux transporter MFP subunit
MIQLLQKKLAPEVILLALFSVSGCGKQAGPPPAPPPPPVTIARPIQKEVVDWDEFTGRTDAVQIVEIRPRVSGYLDNLTFRAGDIVEKGDLLFVIDPRPYQAILNQANGQLRQAEAQKQLQAADLARAQRLQATRVISKEEYDTNVAQANQAAAQYVAAQAAVESAQLNLDFTQIKAPIRGRIGRELVTVGNLVQADSTLLTTIVSVDPIYAYFNMDERSVLKYDQLVRSGQMQDARDGKVPVYMQLENESGFPHAGVIDFLNNQFDSSTGTLQVRGVFPNPDGFLQPGEFVSVRVAGSPKHQAILVTDRAIGTDQGQKFVMVVDANQTVVVRPVELGPITDGLRVIRKGLGPEEDVIINGLVNARPGAKVNPQRGDMNKFASSQLAASVKIGGDSAANPPKANGPPKPGGNASQAH